MSTGKYLSLEEARKDDKLERFAKEHQSTGDKQLFDGLLSAMTEKPEMEKRDHSKSEPKK
ncbi:hypothetical protein MNBD_GAMMA15-709 [hydrothermal vent metagenome]|uniref:Uncharacterized protein n=1 Tax=hydrothermal vent metagenome TaxID=652676 RepID=A0A3B0YAC2_9ZZZZ